MLLGRCIGRLQYELGDLPQSLRSSLVSSRHTRVGIPLMQIKAVGDDGAIDYNVSDETLVSLRKRWNRWMRHWSYRARRLAPRVRPGQGKSPSALGESREHHAALPR